MVSGFTPYVILWRMIESFVDVTYRTVELARRVKLSSVCATSGYLEVAAPMPVGSELAVTTDERVQFTVTVIAVHEQIAGGSQNPGMKVAPQLAAENAKSWWLARATLPDEAPIRRRSAELVAQVAAESSEATHDIVDDGRRTTMMDAVDPALLEQLLSGESPTAEPAPSVAPSSAVVATTTGEATGKRRSKRSRTKP
jgi:hypothetical protein